MRFKQQHEQTSTILEDEFFPCQKNEKLLHIIETIIKNSKKVLSPIHKNSIFFLIFFYQSSQKIIKFALKVQMIHIPLLKHSQKKIALKIKI